MSNTFNIQGSAQQIVLYAEHNIRGMLTSLTDVLYWGPRPSNLTCPDPHHKQTSPSSACMTQKGPAHIQGDMAHPLGLDPECYLAISSCQKWLHGHCHNTAAWALVSAHSLHAAPDLLACLLHPTHMLFVHARLPRWPTQLERQTNSFRINQQKQALGVQLFHCGGWHVHGWQARDSCCRLTDEKPLQTVLDNTIIHGCSA